MLKQLQQKCVWLQLLQMTDHQNFSVDQIKALKEAPQHTDKSQQQTQQKSSVQKSLSNKQVSTTNSTTTTRVNNVQQFEESKNDQNNSSNTQWFNYGVNEFNKIKFKATFNVDQDDNSLVIVSINPQQDGDYYLHAFIGNYKVLIIDSLFFQLSFNLYELQNSPQEVTIVKSEEQKRQESLAQEERDRLDKLAQQKRLENKIKLELKQKKKQDKEEEKMRQQRLKEEQLKKKREDTEKRAQEAVKRAKEAKEREAKLKEEQRLMRKECRTGGGFNMAKAKKPENQ